MKMREIDHIKMLFNSVFKFQIAGRIYHIKFKYIYKILRCNLKKYQFWECSAKISSVVLEHLQ